MLKKSKKLTFQNANFSIKVVTSRNNYRDLKWKNKYSPQFFMQMTM